MLAVIAAPASFASNYPNPTQEAGMVDLLALGDFEWNAVAGVSHYDVVAGFLPALVNLDPAAAEPPSACIADRVPPDTTSFRFGRDLEPGTAFFFLVDYVSYAGATNGRSGYGSDSSAYDLQPVVAVDICP